MSEEMKKKLTSRVLSEQTVTTKTVTATATVQQMMGTEAKSAA